MSSPDSIFDAARRAVPIDVLAGAETKLRGGAAEKRGPCPLCGAGAKGKSPPFAAQPAKGKFRCYVCEAWGDVVDLEQQLRGGSPLEAARRLVGGEYVSAARPDRSPPAAVEGPSNADKIALDLWAEGRPIAGTLAERYLRARAISAEVIAEAAAALRYHPFAKWGWDGERRDWIKAPALLVQVVTTDGPTGGVHATYLARDGSGKAALDPPKRMWGPQFDAAGRPGGAWLIGPAGVGDLAVGEGLETVLSLVDLGRRGARPLRACAALSLNRLQGGLLKDEENCGDFFDPRPDPERPAFTWPAPNGAPWGTVLIAVDRDMSPIKVLGRTGRGKPCRFELGGEARSRLCGRLAVANWLAAGAPRARAVAPPPGADFNDELRRVVALEGTA